MNGKDSVRKVLELYNQQGGAYLDIISQYYGQVIENIECDKSIQTAVEVTAGGRYCYMIY